MSPRCAAACIEATGPGMVLHRVRFGVLPARSAWIRFANDVRSGRLAGAQKNPAGPESMRFGMVFAKYYPIVKLYFVVEPAIDYSKNTIAR